MRAIQRPSDRWQILPSPLPRRVFDFFSVVVASVIWFAPQFELVDSILIPFSVTFTTVRMRRPVVSVLISTPWTIRDWRTVISGFTGRDTCGVGRSVGVHPAVVRTASPASIRFMSSSPAILFSN
jgi:hypothetical protein